MKAKGTNITGKVKEEIVDFGLKLTEGMKKPRRKFLMQALYGIQASKDVKLSNIARSLKEEIALLKTETRLSRQVNAGDVTEELVERMMGMGAAEVKRDTVLAIDISEVRKDYAKKMEYLAHVRDGSRSGEIVKGYWLMGVFAAEVEGEGVVPLYSDLYSQKAKGFGSENRQIQKAIESVKGKTEDKGIWAIDRGGDRKGLLNGFLAGKSRFVVRLVGKRHLVEAGEGKRSAREMAEEMKCGQSVKLKVQKEGVKEQKVLWFGRRKVRLPWRKEELFLVVVKGFGEKPLMLLSNVRGKTIQEILEIYLTRWKCEESYRFIKQSYKLEDVRVRSYVGLRNMVVLVQAVFYFLAVELGERLKVSVLVKKIYEKAQRFFEVAEFKYYALADGIYWILVGARAGPLLTSGRKKERALQTELPFLL